MPKILPKIKFKGLLLPVSRLAVTRTALGGLPPDKHRYAVYAEEVLKDAIAKLIL